MFPLVPYHALQKLHEAVKDDCPAPYPGIVAAWREIVPALLRQVKDPAYHIKRRLPEPKARLREAAFVSEAKADAEGWVEACPAAALRAGDVVRFDHGRKTFALYRDDAGQLYATDGVCTHGNVHLSEGLVKGGTIECSKHNGRFHLIDGSPARAPICRGLGNVPHRANRRQTSRERRPRWRRRGAGAEDLPLPRRQQSQRGHLHQGAGA